jgi:hypothetical protein
MIAAAPFSVPRDRYGGITSVNNKARSVQSFQANVARRGRRLAAKHHVLRNVLVVSPGDLAGRLQPGLQRLRAHGHRVVVASVEVSEPGYVDDDGIEHVPWPWEPREPEHPSDWRQLLQGLPDQVRGVWWDAILIGCPEQFHDAALERSVALLLDVLPRRPLGARCRVLVEKPWADRVSQAEATMRWVREVLKAEGPHLPISIEGVGHYLLKATWVLLRQLYEAGLFRDIQEVMFVATEIRGVGDSIALEPGFFFETGVHCLEMLHAICPLEGAQFNPADGNWKRLKYAGAPARVADTAAAGTLWVTVDGLSEFPYRIAVAKGAGAEHKWLLIRTKHSVIVDNHKANRVYLTGSAHPWLRQPETAEPEYDQLLSDLIPEPIDRPAGMLVTLEPSLAIEWVSAIGACVEAAGNEIAQYQPGEPPEEVQRVIDRVTEHLPPEVQPGVPPAPGRPKLEAASDRPSGRHAAAPMAGRRGGEVSSDQADAPDSTPQSSDEEGSTDDETLVE